MVHGVASSAVWDVVLPRLDMVEVRWWVVEDGWEKGSSDIEGEELKVGDDWEEADRRSHCEIRDRVEGGSADLDFKRLIKLG